MRTVVAVRSETSTCRRMSKAYFSSRYKTFKMRLLRLDASSM